MDFYHPPEHRYYPDGEAITLRPNGPVGGCELVVFVLRDFSRVFVGGSQWGFDSHAREADEVEIEALAERFGWEELRRVLQTRRTGHPAAG